MNIDRLLSKVVKRYCPHSDPNIGPCWESNMGNDKDGYSTMTISGKSCKSHRVSWEYFNGIIPVGMLVCHKCDNPPCINPEHLFIGTALDNAQDAFKKGRSIASHPEAIWTVTNPEKITTRGSKCHFSKLKDNQVLEIRLRISQNEPVKRIAIEFDVSICTIYAIKNRETWSHI